MINIDKHIDYWMSGADDDLITADLLISQKRLLHGLFFCHLVIEKAIKAHFVKNNNDTAPKTHNLLYLAENSGLNMSEEIQIFFGILMKYQLEGRYPDYNPVIPELSKVLEYLNKTKQIIQWLKEKL